MKKLSVLMRLDRYELLGINRRMHDPAQRLGGKWLLALIVLAAIAAVGVAFAYCMGIAYALSAIGALAVFPVMLVSVSALVALIHHHRQSRRTLSLARAIWTCFCPCPSPRARWPRRAS